MTSASTKFRIETRRMRTQFLRQIPMTRWSFKFETKPAVLSDKFFLICMTKSICLNAALAHVTLPIWASPTSRASTVDDRPAVWTSTRTSTLCGLLDVDQCMPSPVLTIVPLRATYWCHTNVVKDCHILNQMGHKHYKGSLFSFSVRVNSSFVFLVFLV